MQLTSKGDTWNQNKNNTYLMKYFWGVCEKVRFLFYSDSKIKQASIDLYLTVSWLIQRGPLLTSTLNRMKDTLWLIWKSDNVCVSAFQTIQEWTNIDVYLGCRHSKGRAFWFSFLWGMCRCVYKVMTYCDMWCDI